MVSFQAIKQNIVNMEYGLSKPSSLIVLFPVVSLIFRRMQVSHLLKTLQDTNPGPTELYKSTVYKKFETIYKAHALGSLIQTISLIFLSKYQPLFVLPIACSIYELLSSLRGMSYHEIEWNKGKLDIKMQL